MPNVLAQLEPIRPGSADQNACIPGQRKVSASLAERDFTENVYMKFVEEQKRPSTLKGYRDMLGRHWQTRCGDVLLRDVRTCNVQAWLDSIAAKDTSVRIL